MGGGPGIRVHQFGGAGARGRPAGAQQGPTSPFAAIQGLLPLILLIVLPMLSSLFSSSGPTFPTTRFDTAVPPQTMQHLSSRLNVQYFVSPHDVKDYTTRKWKELDSHVEGRYLNKLSNECQIEQNTKQGMFQAAQGFWSRDEVKWEAAKQYEMPACRQLQSWGVRIDRL